MKYKNPTLKSLTDFIKQENNFQNFVRLQNIFQIHSLIKQYNFNISERMKKIFQKKHNFFKESFNNQH